MDEDRKRRRRRAATTWLPLLLLLGGVLIAWLLVRHRGWKTSEVVATVGVVGTTCGWVGTFLERRLEARTSRLEAKPTAPSLAAEQLEVWRQWLRAQVLAARVEQGSQLDQMVSTGGASRGPSCHLRFRPSPGPAGSDARSPGRTC